MVLKIEIEELWCLIIALLGLFAVIAFNLIVFSDYRELFQQIVPNNIALTVLYYLGL